MEPLRPWRGRHLHVTIVADNPDTLEGLESYLRRAGVTTNGTQHIERSCEMTPPSSSVVVLFPDDFRPEAVMSALAALRAHRPAALPMLVTMDPKRFASLPASGMSLLPLVVPKPVWGWTILDAIRARFDAEPPQGEGVL